MKELKADAYLERLDQLQRKYAELENWVEKERKRVVKKIQREERRLISQFREYVSQKKYTCIPERKSTY